MAKSTRESKKPIYIILVVSLLLSLSYVYYKKNSPTISEPVGVFSIEPQPLIYGQTKLSGILKKDTTIDEKGNYILILPDTRPVLLVSEEIDPLVGEQVSVSGLLVPPLETGEMLVLFVDKITSAN